MRKSPVERRLAAIVALDTANYSGLMGIDEVGTHRMLKAHFSVLIEPAVAAHHGRMVRSTGDGALFEFASVVDAIACAVAIQRGMIERNSAIPADRRVVFRIGINIGDVIIDDGDIFGEGVNVAARLEALCEPGGLCISRAANEQVRDKLSLSFADLGEHVVKNIARAVGVYGLSARDIASLPQIPVATNAHGAAAGGHPRRPILRALIATAVLALFIATLLRIDGLISVSPPVTFEQSLVEAISRALPAAAAEYRVDQVQQFIRSGSHRALAIAPVVGKAWVSTAWPTAAMAEERALERCQLFYDEPCAILAVDNDLIPPASDGVWRVRDAPNVRYSGAFNVGRIPVLRPNDANRIDLLAYSTSSGPKAIALHARGALHIVAGAPNQADAEERALRSCNADPLRQSGPGACFLYAADNRVVLPLRSTTPLTPVVSAIAPAAGGPTAAQTPVEATWRSAFIDTLRRLVPDVPSSSFESMATDYRNAPQHRAFVVAPPAGTWRSFGSSNANQATERALEACAVRYGAPCIVIAVNDAILAPAKEADRPLVAMPRVSYAGVFDVERIPAINATVRQRPDVAGYATAPEPKAAAIHPLGRLFVVTRAASQRGAEVEALAQCNATVQQGGSPGPCLLYAVGNQVVLPRRLTSATTSE